MSGSDIVSRPRKSPYPMISVEEAQKIVLDHCKSIGHQIETISFKQALHRVLAVDIKAQDPLPPFPGVSFEIETLFLGKF